MISTFDSVRMLQNLAKVFHLESLTNHKAFCQSRQVSNYGKSPRQAKKLWESATVQWGWLKMLFRGSTRTWRAFNITLCYRLFPCVFYKLAQPLEIPHHRHFWWSVVMRTVNVQIGQLLVGTVARLSVETPVLSLCAARWWLPTYTKERPAMELWVFNAQALVRIKITRFDCEWYLEYGFYILGKLAWPPPARLLCNITFFISLSAWSPQKCLSF